MRESRRVPRIQHNRNNGFSTLELLIVVVISLIVAAVAIPAYNTIVRTIRIAGDGRDLNGAVNEAKMQAASSFTRARAYADLAANTFHTEIWNKTGNGGAGCWQTVGDPTNPCTVPGTSAVQNLSQGVTFGFAGVGAPPPNSQAAIAQAPACGNINGGNGTIASTACIVFNSRGIPVDPASGAPTGSDAFYITDNNTVYGMTINAAGLSQVWAISVKSGSGNNSWYHR